MRQTFLLFRQHGCFGLYIKQVTYWTSHLKCTHSVLKLLKASKPKFDQNYTAKISSRRVLYIHRSAMFLENNGGFPVQTGKGIKDVFKKQQSVESGWIQTKTNCNFVSHYFLRKTVCYLSIQNYRISKHFFDRHQPSLTSTWLVFLLQVQASFLASQAFSPCVARVCRVINFCNLWYIYLRVGRVQWVRGITFWDVDD